VARRIFLRSLLGLLVAGMLGVAAAAPTAAYGGGPANWQLAFAGTATAPGSGFGFGFWGWCEFNGVSAGTGDCQVTQYVHLPRGGGVNCHQSINVTSWTGSGGTFVLLSGTTTTSPSSAAAACAAPGGPGGLPASFNTPFDTMFPTAAGHYNLTALFLFPGAVGELQLQVTQIR
jgi:hypothetical protein